MAVYSGSESMVNNLVSAITASAVLANIPYIRVDSII